VSAKSERRESATNAGNRIEIGGCFEDAAILLLRVVAIDEGNDAIDIVLESRYIISRDEELSLRQSRTCFAFIRKTRIHV